MMPSALMVTTVVPDPGEIESRRRRLVGPYVNHRTISNHILAYSIPTAFED